MIVKLVDLWFTMMVISSEILQLVSHEVPLTVAASHDAHSQLSTLDWAGGPVETGSFSNMHWQYVMMTRRMSV